MILTFLFLLFLVLAAPAAYPGNTAWPYGYGFLWLAVLCLGVKAFLGAHVA